MKLLLLVLFVILLVGCKEQSDIIHIEIPHRYYTDDRDMIPQKAIFKDIPNSSQTMVLSVGNGPQIVYLCETNTSKWR